jgi:peptidyl-prolyl cis-trans isomerase D
MFDFFRRHTRVLQFVLVLLVFPSFVFFGIQGYSGMKSGDQQTVATVDGHPPITIDGGGLQRYKNCLP